MIDTDKLEKDAAFIAAARDAVPSLIAEVRRLGRILDALREPSEVVVVACARALRQRDDGVTWDTWDSIKYQTRQQMMEEARPIVLAAVAAAEQEATS